MRNLLTVDVEDYYQVESFSHLVPRDAWDGMEPRVESNTRKVLNLLSAASVRATFFVLGWVAERHPQLVKDIADRGHEIASHGYDHRMLTECSPEEFRTDIRRSRQILEDLVSLPVRGYRAPTFSIGPRTAWAWDILVEEGFEYDSSSFPVHHDRYGNPKGRRYVHTVESRKGGGSLLEFPLTTLRILGVNFPAAGGGYLRLLPQAWIRLAIRESNHRGFPAVIYFHPWELDAEQPRIQASLPNRFRHYVNLGKMEHRIRSLLGWTGFDPVRDYVNEWKKEHEGPPSSTKAGVGTQVVEYGLSAAVEERNNLRKA